MLSSMALCRTLLVLSSIPVLFAAIDSPIPSSHEIIEKDIVIIGGGATGSHAAVRLREDYNKTVLLIEKEAILGGHVDTHYDEEVGVYRDFGVQIYFPYEDALDFIARFNLTLVPGLAPRGNRTSRYVDFKTGQELVNFVPPGGATQQQGVVNFYNAVVNNGYDKMIEPGFWNLPPGPQIPDDLLLPIGEFARKYNASEALTRIWQGTGGGAGSRGNFEDVLTLTVLQSFSPAYMKIFLGQISYSHIQDGNQKLYDKIAALLGNDVLFKTTVVTSERSVAGVKLLVSSNDGQQTRVSAKKLLLAVPPTRENLASFDLNPEETALFSKPHYGRYHTAVITHPALPRGVEFTNTPITALEEPHNPYLPPPFVLSFDSYGNDTSLFSIGTSGDFYELYTQQAAENLAQKNLQTMAAAGVLPDLQNKTLKVVQWSDHGPGGFGVSATDMRDGWMANMYGLQGKRSTWFTGNAIAIDFSPTLWKFNDDLFTRILKDW